MEPKKNPKYDVHRQRGFILNVSMVVSIALVISAFQWAVPTKKIVPHTQTTLAQAEVDYRIPITKFQDEKTVEKPKKVVAMKPVPIIRVTEAENTLAVSADKLLPLDQGHADTSEYSFDAMELPLEPETPLRFEVVETKPAPLGGLDGFRKLLNKNLKYPKLAIRHQTQGKVYVIFTISKTGEVSDIKIHKGVGNGCDEEAMRVIALSKWTPGKQRGKPVAVRMIQPIVFSLGEQ